VPPDATLLQRLKNGDEQAFEQLVDQHYPAMIRLADTFVSERSAAEEIVQETWTVVIDGLDSFEGKSSLKTWIFGILTNLARKRRKHDAREPAWSTLSDEPLDEEASRMSDRFEDDGHWSVPPRQWKNDPESEAMQTQLLERVQEVIDKLPARQRAAVMLRDVEGLSTDEVCEVLDVSKGNQRVLLHRGRNKIREALEETAFRDDEAGS
jgi:RNA polymerase sigma-70 factor (ECF subfamily)